MSKNRSPLVERSVATGAESERRKPRAKNRCTYTHVPTYKTNKEKRELSALIQILLT